MAISGLRDKLLGWVAPFGRESPSVNVPDGNRSEFALNLATWAALAAANDDADDCAVAWQRGATGRLL